jgi:hypothetical protein
MKKFMKSLAFTALAAVTLNSASAHTSPLPIKPFAVTFDPATGTGFVGKGDVQTAFNWNNSQLQKNAGGVAFTYNAVDKYTITCEWTTGEGTRGEQTHDVDHKKTTSVNSEVLYDARTRNQINGFVLKGYGSTLTGGSAPEVGGACPGNPGTGAVITAVTFLQSTGGLYVNHGGTAVLLPNTPVL